MLKILLTFLVALFLAHNSYPQTEEDIDRAIREVDRPFRKEAQDEISAERRRKEELYIRTIFQAGEGVGPLKDTAANDIRKELAELGKIIITDQDYQYTIWVVVERRKGSAGLSSITLSAKVTEPDSEKVLYSDSATGALYELRNISKNLVVSIDKGFLEGKYKKAVSAEVSVFSGMDKKDIRSFARELRAAGHVDKDLTEAEIAIVHRYPEEAPKIAQITKYAKDKSEEARRKDPRVPEDAYRHVLWSYLLTKEFGAEFAKEITDAHEFGATGNTPRERRMDLMNNEAGRRYALEGYPEDSILERVMRDPKVIRTP
jgi:hypothetical protein